MSTSIHWRVAELPPNNSFKPNLLRYTNNMAGKACHVVASATQVGLTQALDFTGKIMLKLATTILILCLVPNISTAATVGEDQAGSFVRLYSSLCLKHVNNLDALRQKLERMPRLPPEKAAHFLAGRAGDAWPVPDKYGTFVLVLLSGKSFCAVYARRADTEAVEKQFARLVATAPPPLTAKQVTNKHAQTSANGPTHTVSYEWYVPSAHRKMLFTLTTASFASAQIQVMGSAAIISE